VRSLLASKPIYVKLPKEDGSSGKGHDWTLEPVWFSKMNKEDLFSLGKIPAKLKKDDDDDEAPEQQHSRQRRQHDHIEQLVQAQQHLEEEEAATAHRSGGNLSLLTDTLDTTARPMTTIATVKRRQPFPGEKDADLKEGSSRHQIHVDQPEADLESGTNGDEMSDDEF